MSKIDKWRKWSKSICHDSGNMILSMEMFLAIQQMVNKNLPMQSEDYFYTYLNDTYLAHVVMMLRKHAKTRHIGDVSISLCKPNKSRDNSISLAVLGQELLDHPDQIPTSFDSQQFQMKLDYFKACAKKVEGFADRVIAHSDKRPPDYVPTYTEVHEAIAAMDSLAVQCHMVLGDSQMVTCKPVIQGGWLSVFEDMGIQI